MKYHSKSRLEERGNERRREEKKGEKVPLHFFGLHEKLSLHDRPSKMCSLHDQTDASLAYAAKPFILLW